MGHVVNILGHRGYEPLLLPVDGDRPDIEIHDWHRGGRAFVDVKTQKRERYSIKLGALREFRRIECIERTPVYIVWGDNRVDTPDTLSARIVGGPQRATGNGSATDWLLVAIGGTEFNAFFPVRT